MRGGLFFWSNTSIIELFKSKNYLCFAANRRSKAPRKDSQ